MSTRPRVSSAIPGESAHFGTVMMHVPEVQQTFGALYAEFWQHGVAPTFKEMTRLRNARVTDCGF